MTDELTAYNGTYVLRDTTWVYAADQDKPVPGASVLWGDDSEGILAPELMPHNLLTMEGISDHLGLSYGTVRNYRSSGKLPEPVAYLDNTPVWVRPVIDMWHFRRTDQQQQLPI